MIGVIFAVLIVLGTAFHFLATFPNQSYSSRIAWGLWLVASIIWAAPQVGLH